MLKMAEKISWKTVEKYLAGKALVVGECPIFFVVKCSKKVVVLENVQNGLSAKYTKWTRAKS